MQTWIRGGRVITPDDTLDEGVVVIDGSRIAAIEHRPALTEKPAGVDLIDASGLWVLPGLIDLHVHGGAGCDTMDATPQSLHTMARFCLRQGVTAYLPTTITSSPQAVAMDIENVAASGQAPDGAQHLGLHLEGPYLCDRYRGAQPAQWLRHPDPAEYLPLFETGLVRLVTVAPELPGALE